MIRRFAYSIILIILIAGCKSSSETYYIETVNGPIIADSTAVWLAHEHILVDFIGADSIAPQTWDLPIIMDTMNPYLQELNTYNVDYFVDATPNYLGRDVDLLKKLSEESGINILTNTGYYGARDNKYLPEFAFDLTAEEIAAVWIREYEEGISGTSIKPGFIKISVDNNIPLDPMHEKLVKAAAITHLKSGLTIASHTGEAKALWPQLKILKEYGVSPSAFIWVHAQAENDFSNYLKAADEGCWISLDGLGWEFDDHLKKIEFLRANGILDHLLVSHDAGWFDPQKKVQGIQSYTNMFTKLFPSLKQRGFTDQDWTQIVSKNPAKAYTIQTKPYKSE